MPDDRPDNAVRHEFLSPSWIQTVVEIRDEYADRVSAPDVTIRANIVVIETPFEADVRGSVDTSKGLVIEAVELEAPDFTATLDYDTAKALFLGDDAQAVMQAFFGGKIRLTGDASKLLAIPLPNPNDTGPQVDLAREIAIRVRAITA